MHCALLMADEDEFDLRVDQCVEDGDRSTAGEAKNVLDSLTLQALDEFFCSGRDICRHGGSCRAVDLEEIAV
jgi:hypothetical protein